MLERPDEMAALITARMTGQQVRITGMTTESAEYVAHPDGHVEAKVHAGPVRMQQNGKWVPIDLTLQPAADGSVRALAHPLELRISGARKAGGELAAVGVGDGRLSMGWGGALPAPVLNGNRATYPEVATGIDLVVEATRTGFAQFLTVKNREAVDRLPALAFPLTGKGLSSFTQDSSGGLMLKDVKGRPIAAVPAPEMWDARRATGTEEPTRRAVVSAKAERPTNRQTREAGGLTMRLDPDLKWLKDPATQYPVTIDPQINPLYTTFDTYVKEGDTVDRGGANDLQLGLLAGSPNTKARAFVHWGVSALKGKQITSATVNFWNFWSNTCTATSWEIWTTGAASSATRWGTQPSWTQKEATSTQTKGGSTCADGWVTISGTTFFQRAATANQSTAYMGVRGTDEASTNSFKQFRSRNAVDSSQVPYAVVNYNSYPTVGTRSTVPATACVTGASRPKVNTATPQLKSVISDAEGSSVKAEIEWWTLTGTTKLGSSITATAASGSTFSATVPAGVLASNTSYKWRVRGNDGTVDGTWSSFCEFTVDTSIGSPPIISSTTYPENQWGGDANLAGAFTFDPNGIADAAAYEYSLDVQPPNKVVNAPSLGAPATVDITPLTAGWHSIWARSRDSAGNVTELRNYPFKVGSGAVTSPKPGDISGAKAVLGSTAAPSFVDVTYQWRRASSDAWVTVPAPHVTYAAGGGAVTWPVALSNGTAPKLNWDVAATLASVDAASIPRDGPVQVRPHFNLSDHGAPADAVKFRFDRNLASADTAQVGPGSVNLITGNYQLSQSDVSVAGLGISRTVNSRQPQGSDPLFGPGWVSGLVASDADAPYTRLTTYGSLVQVKLPDDSTIGFTKADTAGVNYEPQVGAESYKLTFNAATSTFTLADGAGNVVTFTRTSTDPVNVYTPTAATAPGSGTTTTYSWEKVTVGTTDIMRPTRMLAPVPTGVTCTTLVKGCRALTFTYANATTATGFADGTWGDFLGRVKQISYTAWDPDLATPAMRTVVLARYSYDSGGRLRTFSDPRLDYTNGSGPQQLRTVYYYNGDGIIVSLTPPAQQPWQFSYTTVPNDPGKGRLHEVTRSALTAGTSVETVVYQVPTSGTGAPYDLSGTQTARWAQTEPPTDATAVFPATQVPTGDPAIGTLPSSYERATVAYLDANARTVNTAEPGGHLTTTWYDGYGNTVGELGAGNRKRALDASTTDNATAEAQLAAKLRETSVYSADGQQLLESFGPEHDVMLSTGTVVRGRTHTRYTYDEGAPATGGPYNLGTTERVSVSYVSAGQAVDADTRTSTTQYDWTLQQPTVQIVDPDGLDLTTRTAYDARGAVVSQTSPGGGDSTTTPSTRQTVYYTTAANSIHPECGGRAEWAGAVCWNSAAGQPEQGQQLLSKVTTYDFYGQQRTVTERNSSGVQRTTTLTYDAAGRQLEGTVTGPVSSGEPIEKRRNVYDQASAQLVRTETVNGSGVVTAQVVRGYDALGRSTSFTDADGNVSTTTYDIASRPSVVNDGKGTRTLTYDGGSERRGLPTQLADSQSGNFVGSYDADGVLATQTSPNGLVTSVQLNEAGLITNLTYVKPGCGQSDCTVYAETLSYSGGDERRVSTSTLSGRAYAYDEAGRVITVQDTLSGQCTTRAYSFDQATNRIDLNTFGAGTGGACQSVTALTSQTWSHDSADRLVDTGYTYDALGRTLTQPAADSAVPGGGSAQFTYHVNDMARTAVQGNRQATYTLDVVSNRFRSWTDTATGLVKRHHYSDEGDKPAWTDEGNGNSTRQVFGLAGVAGTFANTTGVTWVITNVNGDNVAGMTETGSGLAYTSEYTEYGLARNSADAGNRRYGWQGSAQRAADTPGGVVLMGARIYNPATGRFLSNDPVYGGNANSYEYSTGDPVNKHDHSGALSCWRYNKYWSNWYYWWGSYGGRRYSTDFSCYLSHGDFAWLGTYGLAYGLIASFLTGWFAAAYAIAAFIIGVMYLHYDHWCRSKGATYKGRVRLYYDRNWNHHHFTASYRGWYCN
ncbi:RHS repeat-associated core domain-containing protein [Micromonospora sp. 4G55]|uniref:RHS repeat-associated core domain-containing protein n=1 Tax=Micromonospora sp. 4G55 TaxID=2806102 RepID=UPI001EE4DEE2|nr:RHS repeat-associated core domain-containing protein [Micromonospora sp. 4G55]